MTNDRTWVVRVAAERAEMAGELRLLPDVTAALDGSVLWLRGSLPERDISGRLAALSDGPVLLLGNDDWLIPVGQHVATARLPKLVWKPLRDVLRARLPIARMPAFRCVKVELTLVRSDKEQPATVLVADWTVFRDWALEAPEVRLRACRFAMENGDTSNDRRVIIVGDPLPPLDGARFWRAGCVALPLGWSWSPAVSARTLETVVLRAVGAVDDAGESGSLNEDSRSADGTNECLVIWNQEGTSVVREQELIPVTRANVRASVG